MFKDYSDEIRQCYELGFVTPIHVYSGRVFVLDEVAMMGIGDRQMATDEISSKLVGYFVKGDGGGGIARWQRMK